MFEVRNGFEVFVTPQKNEKLFYAYVDDITRAPPNDDGRITTVGAMMAKQQRVAIVADIKRPFFQNPKGTGDTRTSVIGDLFAIWHRSYGYTVPFIDIRFQTKNHLTSTVKQKAVKCSARAKERCVVSSWRSNGYRRNRITASWYHTTHQEVSVHGQVLFVSSVKAQNAFFFAKFCWSKANIATKTVTFVNTLEHQTWRAVSENHTSSCIKLTHALVKLANENTATSIYTMYTLLFIDCLLRLLGKCFKSFFAEHANDLHRRIHRPNIGTVLHIVWCTLFTRRRTRQRTKFCR